VDVFGSVAVLGAVTTERVHNSAPLCMLCRRDMACDAVFGVSHAAISALRPWRRALMTAGLPPVSLSASSFSSGLGIVLCGC